MNFSEALTELKNGKGLTRASWSGGAVVRIQRPDENSKMTSPYFYITSKSGVQPVGLNHDSILADDWQVVEEEEK